MTVISDNECVSLKFYHKRNAVLTALHLKMVIVWNSVGIEEVEEREKGRKIKKHSERG